MKILRILKTSTTYNYVCYYIQGLDVNFQLNTQTKTTASDKKVKLKLFNKINNYHTKNYYPNKDILILLPDIRLLGILKHLIAK